MTRTSYEGHSSTFQDVLQAVVVDCDGPALRRVKNIESFLDRYQAKSRDITKWRTNDKDFDVLKTIGKGEHQLDIIVLLL